MNKYFNWLGIKNEGIRRIILVMYSSLAIIFTIWYFDYLYFKDYGLSDYVMDTLLILLLFVAISIFIKTITWIKQGFDNNGNS